MHPHIYIYIKNPLFLLSFDVRLRTTVGKPDVIQEMPEVVSHHQLTTARSVPPSSLRLPDILNRRYLDVLYLGTGRLSFKTWSKKRHLQHLFERSLCFGPLFRPWQPMPLATSRPARRFWSQVAFR